MDLLSEEFLQPYINDFPVQKNMDFDNKKQLIAQWASGLENDKFFVAYTDTIADTVIERLIDSSYIIELKGDSMRKKK